MTIRERLIYAIDVVTDGAKTGISGFRNSVSEAEGTVGKFKAGASSAMSTIQQNAGLLAVSGGAALVAFGAKAVGAFQETALAAGKFSDATGLGVEDASRWLEVAGDMGLASGTVEGLFTKMNKAIGSGGPQVEKWGISLKTAADGTADVNATMLDAIQRIGDIVDPTERAQAAQEVFGRSYKDAAELIFGSADELKQKLGEVSDAKVINEDELRKAREFRDSMENLKDVSQDLATVTGQTLVPVLGDLADFLVQVRDRAVQAKGAIEDIPGGRSLLDALSTNLFELPGKSKKEWDDLGRTLGVLPPKTDDIERSLRGAIETAAGIKPATEDAAAGIDDLGEAADGAVPKITSADQAWQNYIDAQERGLAVADGAPGTFEEMGAAADAALGEVGTAATDAAADFNPLLAAIQGVATALDEGFADTRNQLRQEGLFAGIADQLGAIATAQQAINDAETDDATATARRDHADAVRRLRVQVLDLLGTYDDIPVEKKTEILALINDGSLEAAKTALDKLTHGGFIPVEIVPTVRPGFTGVNVTVAPNAIPNVNLLGLNPGPTYNTTNNFPVGSGPTAGSQDARLYEIRNGYGSYTSPR